MLTPTLRQTRRTAILALVAAVALDYVVSTTPLSGPGDDPWAERAAEAVGSLIPG